MKNTEKPKVVKSSYKFTTVPQAMNLLKKLKAEEEQKSASPKKTKKEKGETSEKKEEPTEEKQEKTLHLAISWQIE